MINTTRLHLKTAAHFATCDSVQEVRGHGSHLSHSPVHRHRTHRRQPDEDFFVGPESPGVPPILDTPEAASSNPGSYKDAQHRIKRQGARFRIYACTEDLYGQVTDVQEITTSDARIEWEVHLVNAKAAAQRLDGAGRRNAARPESDLVIDAGAQRISGASQAMKALGGTFLTTFDVKLGDLVTDSAGRLIVLGGHGRSQWVPTALSTTLPTTMGGVTTQPMGQCVPPYTCTAPHPPWLRRRRGWWWPHPTSRPGSAMS